MLSISFWPIVGGLTIGAASVLLLLMNGRLAGVSGIMWGAISRSTGDRLWQPLFIVGLLAGAWVFHLLSGAPYPPISDNYLQALAGGLLVGMGVKISSGCTSGHGICGIGRMSPRSIVATITFMITGIVTVYFLNQLLA